MKINYVNADHVYALVDLPTNLSTEEMMQLFKGSSSHWINSNDVVRQKFASGRGYGVFFVSESNLSKMCTYIAEQPEHHRLRSFAEEFRISWNGMDFNGEKVKPLKRLAFAVHRNHRPKGRC